MKKIKLFIPLLALTLFACDNYLDVNTDPNKLQFDQVQPDKLLPAAQVGAYRVQAISMNQLGNVFSNAWGANVQTFTGGYAKEFQLNIDNSFYTGIWDGLYLRVNNFQKIIEFPNNNGENDNYIAVAKILKAYYMQYIVDLYGDAPYTEAFMGGANVTPRYNDDQFIYRQLLTGLDEARALIDAGNSNAVDISAYDVMLHGNMPAWRDFANTIELKMLLRMSGSTGSVAAYRDQRIADMIANGNTSFIQDDVTINPGYSNNNDDQLNPFFFNNLATAAGSVQQNYSFVAPSGHYYKALSDYAKYPPGASTEIIPGSGVNYPDVLDPRRTRIMRNGASQTIFRGVTQGSTVVDMSPTGVAGLPGRIGLGTYNPYNQVAIQSSVLELFGVDGYVMTYAEAQFIQAEASLQFPALAGIIDGQTAFENGITSSFSFRLDSSVGPSLAGPYITTINTKPYFGWTGSDSQKIHAVLYQKWIALIGVNGIESYIDNTRTGFPLTPLALTASQPRKPRRLIYPVSEYVANTANVPNITPADIFAPTHPSHPFWLLGDPALGN